MSLNTQVNLAESDKVSFYNQKEWLEEYESEKGIFYIVSTPSWHLPAQT